MNRTIRAAAIPLAALFLALPVFAQTSDGNLSGTIIDVSGAAVPEAKVELSNVETGVKYPGRSDSSGLYFLRNIPVGKYTLLVAADGFQSYSLANLAIELNRTSTVNVTLQVGAVSTTVDVTAASATIDTTTARVTNAFSTRQALSLPTTGTGVLGVINLSLINAGVTSSGGVGYGTGPSVGGQRPTNNNFMIEGADNNNRSVTGPIINPSNEAVAEFSLQQNQFSPEFGHSTGGQFNTVLKSGTNEIHGSAYDYLQNKLITAVDESFKRQGIREQPRFDQNRFGATLGGPILKNKWFIFGNAEASPLGQASTASAAIFVPTSQGLSMLDGLTGISKTNLDVFKQWVPPAVAPAEGRFATVRGVQIPLGIFQAAAPSYSDIYHYAVSSDYNISERDQLRARYLYTRQNAIDTVANIPQFFTPVQLRNHLASLAHFHTFSPTLTNELRLGYTRRVEDRPVGDYQFPGLDAFPNLQFDDLSLTIGPNSSYPQGSRSNTFQLTNNVNWIKGRHNFKFGYDGRKLNISNFFVQRNRGEYIYDTLERYLLDITPGFAERSVGGFPFIGNLLSHYVYANDDWRVLPNLTINLGVRYEYVGVPQGAKDQSLNSISNVPGLITFDSPKATKKDFAPRVGIAWSPGQDGKTSIRAGFGMGYDQLYQNLGTNSSPPQFFTTIDAHVDHPNAPDFLRNGGIPGGAAPITSPAIARALTSSYIPDQVRPYSINWNFGVQRVIASDYTVEVRYLGTRGVHLPYQLQINRMAAVTAQRNLPTYLARPSQAQLDALPLTLADLDRSIPVHPLSAAGFSSTITAFMPRGNSTYHGLATQVNRRFSNGIQFVGAYTWSHNIDDSTAALNSTVLSPRRPEDFFNLKSERASSALDRRHRFTFSGIYDLPFFRSSTSWALKNLVGNWMLSGTYIAETGAWGTVRSGTDSNLNTDNAADRTIINPDGVEGTGSGVTPLCRGTGACTNATRDRIVGYVATNPNAQYITAGQGSLPTAGRNTLRLPGINNFDFAVAKRINVRESMFFEIRAEAYNAFNHAQYIPGFPSVATLRSRTAAGVQALLLANNPNFNRPDLAFQSNSRFLQLVARFQW